MTYLDALDAELRGAVIAFAGLAVTGLACAVTFLVATRAVVLPPIVHQVGVGPHRAAWLAPLWAMSAQVAFAAGVLALLRVWRLRHLRVMTGRDAQILYRRAGIGLLAGAVTAGSLPLGITAAPGVVYVRSQGVGAACLLMLLVMLAFALLAGRPRPSSEGAAGDLRFDLGTSDPRVTPWRVALALSSVIVVALAVLGIATGDPYDGALRGIGDAIACLAGFALLGRYLGLRTTRQTAQ